MNITNTLGLWKPTRHECQDLLDKIDEYKINPKKAPGGVACPVIKHKRTDSKDEWWEWYDWGSIIGSGGAILFKNKDVTEVQIEKVMAYLLNFFEMHASGSPDFINRVKLVAAKHNIKILTT